MTTYALPTPQTFPSSSGGGSVSGLGIESDENRVNTIIACPFIYGSSATVLPKKSHDVGTHKWTLFLRGPNGEDLSGISTFPLIFVLVDNSTYVIMSCSVFISKVVFTLHPSFAISVREVTSHPFEVHEAGWGEFDAGIEIHFHDPGEKPISITHFLKLFPNDIPPHMTNIQAMRAYKRPVISEVYDEIVFVDPCDSFKQCLMSYRKPEKPVTHELSEYFTAFDDEEDIYRLTVIRDHIQREIESAKGKLVMQDVDISNLHATRASVPKVTAKPQPADASKDGTTATKGGDGTKKKRAPKNADDSKPAKKRKKEKESNTVDGVAATGRSMVTTGSDLSSSSIPEALPPTPIAADLPLASSGVQIKTEQSITSPPPPVASVTAQGSKQQFTSLAQVYNANSHP